MNAPEPRLRPPPCLVVMGVSACGKSVVGHGVAQRLGGVFIDGDDHHPEENVSKMAAGTPLAEEDRWPWLDALHAIMEGHLADAPADCPLVVACSALKQIYRERLQRGLPLGQVRFVHLDLSFDAALDRIDSRRDHFMKGRHMLEDQFRVLEPLTADERAAGSFAVDASQGIAEVVDKVTRQCGAAL
ncbi:MAG: gluconokinase [Pirellulales bacterium]|jgi:gluconokinase